MGGSWDLGVKISGGVVGYLIGVWDIIETNLTCFEVNS